MTTANEPVDQEWGKLADAPEADREKEMQRLYGQLAELQESDRQTRLLAMARAEYALPAEQLRNFTMSRMRVLLRMLPPQAKLVALSYHAIMQKMPGPAAMRRVSLIQTLAAQFSTEDQVLLRDINPGIFGGLPAKEVRPPPVAKPAEPQKASKPAKKGGFWPFGKK